MTAHAYIPASGLRGKINRFTARTLARAPLPITLSRSIVTFTFDDIPQSAARVAAPALEREDWWATYFISAGFLNSENHHGALFEASDLRRLSEAGHEIGCHSFSHRDASQTSAELMQDDLDRNQDALAEMGHLAPLTSFAYPYGEATPAFKRIVQDRFRAGRGVRPGINRGIADRGLLRAIALDGGAAGLERALEAVSDITHSPGWLIFYGHDVQENPSEWGCTPQFLDRVIDAVRGSGARVCTMNDALDIIEGRP